MNQSFPIGISDFKKLVTENYIHVDKTLMLKEFLDYRYEVTLITRPRRWGKSLTISMFEYFFAKDVNKSATDGLFDGLKISKVDDGKYIKNYQGQYPVINIDFKDVGVGSFEEAYSDLTLIISNVFRKFKYLLKSKEVDTGAKNRLKKILDEKADKSLMKTSIRLLTECLFNHHGKKVIILIDEYDCFMNKAYGNENVLNNLVEFMSGFFSSTLKSNAYLQYALMTGILRISKDNMLSGLNNLAIYTLLDSQYSDHYGFNEEDVLGMLKKCNLSYKLEEIQAWYNGYNIGTSLKYNPWSVINCLANKGDCRPYWIYSADNSLIKSSISSSNAKVKLNFLKLINSESIEVNINPDVTYDKINSDDTSFWSLLLFSGYLTWTKKEIFGEILKCEVLVSNHEVLIFYVKVFNDWFEKKPDYSNCIEYFKNLASGNIIKFLENLSFYLENSFSFFDLKKNDVTENYYHVFVLATFIFMQGTHLVKSNRESGFGRYDLLVASRKTEYKSYLFEFKKVINERDLEKASKTAFDQISLKNYTSIFNEYPHIEEVIKCGLAFSGKKLKATFCTLNLKSKFETDIIVTEDFNNCGI